MSGRVVQPALSLELALLTGERLLAEAEQRYKAEHCQWCGEKKTSHVALCCSVKCAVAYRRHLQGLPPMGGLPLLRPWKPGLVQDMWNKRDNRVPSYDVPFRDAIEERTGVDLLRPPHLCGWGCTDTWTWEDPEVDPTDCSCERCALDRVIYPMLLTAAEFEDDTVQPWHLRLLRIDDRVHWWRCLNDPSHRWRARAWSRFSGFKTGCPVCARRCGSRREHDIYAELSKILPGLESGASVARTAGGSKRAWRVDMLRTGPPCVAIEYDGARWHKGRDDYDRAKVTDLARQGIRTIRIRERPLSLINPWDVQCLHSEPADVIATRVALALSLLDHS